MIQNFKAIIFTTLTTVFVGLSTPANAFNNGDLYEACKPFVDSGFKTSDIEDFTCVAFLGGQPTPAIESVTIGGIS